MLSMYHLPHSLEQLDFCIHINLLLPDLSLGTGTLPYLHSTPLLALQVEFFTAV